MTDQPKYWITEQGMKELAEDLRDHAWLNLSDPSELDCVIEMIAAHSEAASPPEQPEPGMGWFVTRSTVKQAIQLTKDNWDAIEEFLGRDAWRDGKWWINPLQNKVGIVTPEGTMVADGGDWIIRGVKGEFYPCKPDIFAINYEPFEAAAPPQGTPAPEPDKQKERDGLAIKLLLERLQVAEEKLLELGWMRENSGGYVQADKCPQCLSIDREIVGSACLPPDTDPWHSTVAAPDDVDELKSDAWRNAD